MYIGVIYAAEDTTNNESQNQNVVEGEENSEQVESQNQSEPSENEAIAKVSIVKAKVIEAEEPKEIENGSVKDVVQVLKVEILDSEYETKEFTTNYVLSYDIEGKILASKLRVGDKVTVQLVEDSDGSISVTIDEYQRAKYVYIMFALLLIIIIAIGRRQGIKASLRINIYSFYFIFYFNKMYFFRIKSNFSFINYFCNNFDS